MITQTKFNKNTKLVNISMINEGLEDGVPPKFHPREKGQC